MRFNVPCTRCGGTGKLRTACRTCGGEGRVRRTETIDVRIPAGVANGGGGGGAGKGKAGALRGPPGGLDFPGGGGPPPLFLWGGHAVFAPRPVTRGPAAPVAE